MLCAAALVLVGCSGEADPALSREHGAAVAAASCKVVLARSAADQADATAAAAVDYQVALDRLEEATRLAVEARVREDVIDSSAALGEARGREVLRNMQAHRRRWEAR